MIPFETAPAETAARGDAGTCLLRAIRPTRRLASLFCWQVVIVSCFGGLAPDDGRCTAAVVDPADSNVPQLCRTAAAGAVTRIQTSSVNLRSGGVREWDRFPETVPLNRLECIFSVSKTDQPATLAIAQHDVKQLWQVRLNGDRCGEFVRDEHEQWLTIAVPPGRLREGENRLEIVPQSTAAATSDDIAIGPIDLHEQSRAEWLSEGRLILRARDTARDESIPARFTLVDSDGRLIPIGTTSGPQLAIRTGVVYLAGEAAAITLPAGTCRITAGRGFEYSQAQTTVTVSAGAVVEWTAGLRRVVDTTGYVACDTHVHTLTFSGHGDATLEERLVTLAGEGIELAIVTEHNRHSDYLPLTRQQGLDRWFTSVVGNEWTTSRGHFNVFPCDPGSPPRDHRPPDWRTLFSVADAERAAGPSPIPAATAAIAPSTDRLRVRGESAVSAAQGPEQPGPSSAAPLVILNHARDIHAGFRPFDPSHFHRATGEFFAEPWSPAITAMEVINSGATQTDPLELLHDWMALQTRGLRITPIGSSDSHDVSRYLVGQGRTYIRGDDRDPRSLSTPQLLANLRAGRVLVSYGLLTELTATVTGPAVGPGSGRLADRSATAATTAYSGDIVVWPTSPARPDGAQSTEELLVRLEVRGAEWTTADRVQLFANGVVIREVVLTADEQQQIRLRESGRIGAWEWRLPKPTHDITLVALATGPGIRDLAWRTDAPYQPTSTTWTPRVIGASGAIGVDVDSDGEITSPRALADRLVTAASGNFEQLAVQADRYDEAVAVHLARRLHADGHLRVPPVDPAVTTEAGAVATLPAPWDKASPVIQRGFQRYLTEARRLRTTPSSLSESSEPPSR